MEVSYQQHLITLSAIKLSSLPPATPLHSSAYGDFIVEKIEKEMAEEGEEKNACEEIYSAYKRY